jgi:hypothetical protein
MAAVQDGMLPALTIPHGPCLQRKRLMPLAQVCVIPMIDFFVWLNSWCLSRSCANMTLQLSRYSQDISAQSRSSSLAHAARRSHSNINQNHITVLDRSLKGFLEPMLQAPQLLPCVLLPCCSCLLCSARAALTVQSGPWPFRKATWSLSPCPRPWSTSPSAQPWSASQAACAGPHTGMAGSSLPLAACLPPAPAVAPAQQALRAVSPLRAALRPASAHNQPNPALRCPRCMALLPMTCCCDLIAALIILVSVMLPSL